MSRKLCRERVKINPSVKGALVVIVSGVILCTTVISAGVYISWNYLLGSASGFVLARVPSKPKTENLEKFAYWMLGLTPFMAIVIFLMRSPEGKKFKDNPKLKNIKKYESSHTLEGMKKDEDFLVPLKVMKNEDPIAREVEAFHALEKINQKLLSLRQYFDTKISQLSVVDEFEPKQSD